MSRCGRSYTLAIASLIAEHRHVENSTASGRPQGLEAFESTTEDESSIDWQTRPRSPQTTSRLFTDCPVPGGTLRSEATAAAAAAATASPILTRHTVVRRIYFKRLIVRADDDARHATGLMPMPMPMPMPVLVLVPMPGSELSSPAVVGGGHAGGSCYGIGWFVDCRPFIDSRFPRLRGKIQDLRSRLRADPRSDEPFLSSNSTVSDELRLVFPAVSVNVQKRNTSKQKTAATPATAYFSEMSLADCLDGFVAIVDSTSLIIYISFGVSRILDYLHPSDVPELLKLLQPSAGEASDDMPALLRMKSVLTPRGRNLNLKSALYKTICFTFKDASLCFTSSNESTSLCSALIEREAEEDSEKCSRDRSCQQGVYFFVHGSPVLQCSNQDSIGASLAKYLGYDQKLLTGSSLFTMIHPEDIRSFASSMKEMYNKGQSRTGYYRLLSRTGEVLWVMTEANVIAQSSRGLRNQYVVCWHHMISTLSCQNFMVSSPGELLVNSSAARLWRTDKVLGHALTDSGVDFTNKVLSLDAMQPATLKPIQSCTYECEKSGTVDALLETDISCSCYGCPSAKVVAEEPSLTAEKQDKILTSELNLPQSVQNKDRNSMLRPSDQLIDLNFLMPFVKYKDLVLLNSNNVETSFDCQPLFSELLDNDMAEGDEEEKSYEAGRSWLSVKQGIDCSIKNLKRHPWLNCPLEPVSPLPLPEDEVEDCGAVLNSEPPFSSSRYILCEKIFNRFNNVSYSSFFTDTKDVSLPYHCPSDCLLDYASFGDDQDSSYSTENLVQQDGPPELISLEMADQLESSICHYDPSPSSSSAKATAIKGEVWKRTDTNLSPTLNPLQPCYYSGQGETTIDEGLGEEWRKPFRNVSLYVKNPQEFRSNLIKEAPL
ncbi:unnamed protein product [Soboliphyme baturini]|uniref:PAS domain-containing protein n=1 Tax=Soboliphyme baturini TaxID=241478 RepID=A0A183IDV8_9BILA|nr:unnamed protein product [Soboliphyme baturini]